MLVFQCSDQYEHRRFYRSDYIERAIGFERGRPTKTV